MRPIYPFSITAERADFVDKHNGKTVELEQTAKPRPQTPKNRLRVNPSFIQFSSCKEFVISE
jgi:hypothetical protein